MKETRYIAINYKEGITEAVVFTENGDIEDVNKDIIVTDSLVEYKKWLEEQKALGYKLKFITLGKVRLMAESLGLEIDKEKLETLEAIGHLRDKYFELKKKIDEISVKYEPSMRSPITWYGGKEKMVKDIIDELPPNAKELTYVEGFGGAGHLLFRKTPSKIDVYNDLHSGLYNFFTVLKDEKMSVELINSLTLTLYSRYEFEQSKISLITDDEVEKARKFFVNTIQSFGSMGENFSISKSVSRRGMAQCVSAYWGHVEDLPKCHDRLQNVEVENLDIFDLIDKYDSPTTLFYLDPPYVQSTRAKSARNVYKHEMEDSLQVKLVERMATIQGYVLISGYRNEIYNKLSEYGFKEKVLGTYTERSSSSSTRGTREEMLWMNYDEETGRKYRSVRF